MTELQKALEDTTWTDREIATEFEVAESTVRRWRNGIATPVPHLANNIIAFAKRKTTPRELMWTGLHSGDEIRAEEWPPGKTFKVLNTNDVDDSGQACFAGFYYENDQRQGPPYYLLYNLKLTWRLVTRHSIPIEPEPKKWYDPIVRFIRSFK